MGPGHQDTLKGRCRVSSWDIPASDKYHPAGLPRGDYFPIDTESVIFSLYYHQHWILSVKNIFFDSLTGKTIFC